MDEDDCISNKTNTLVKVMNPMILSQINSRADWPFNIVLEKESSELKAIKLCLKIDLVSYPARAEGLVNIGQINQIRIFVINE